MLPLFSLFFSLSLSVLCTAQKLIVPGTVPLDTAGNAVTAHGGGIVHVNNTFYWVGSARGCCDDTLIYSSPDLVTWTNHGVMYSNGVSRPKLVFSETTGKWQILGQVGRQLDIASSTNILGPYTQAVTPFSPFGVNFTDFGLFEDDDGQAYTIYSADHNNLVISQLSADRLSYTKVMHQFNGNGLEGPAIFKDGNTYFAMGSHKTAYLLNNNVIYSAQNLTGPWSVQSYIAPFGTRTWNTQSGFFLTVKGLLKTTHIYMGDRWQLQAIQNSTYVWLPLTVDAVTKGVQAPWQDAYSIDVKTGLVLPALGTKYEAERGIMTPGAAAYIATCPTCSGNKIVTNISANGSLTLNNIVGRGQPQWVSFHYINTDGLFGDLELTDPVYASLTIQRNTTVSLNGATPLFLPQMDSNAGIVMSVPLQLNLTRGRANSITYSALDHQVAGDLDYIVVY